MCRLISRQEIGTIFFFCNPLLTFHRKQSVGVFVSGENSASRKILKWKKNYQLITKKNNKKTPAARDESMTPECAFSMNRSVQAIHNEGRGRISVSVACFNCSIAEV